MPVRTVEFVIHNFSSRELRLLDTKHYWGEWRPTGPPPSVIPPGGQGRIRSESGGPTSGTQGWVKYSFTPGFAIAASEVPLPPYTISVAWDNPFFAGVWGRSTAWGIGLSAASDVYLDKDRLIPDQVPQRKDVPGRDVRYFRFVEGMRTQDAGEGGATWSELVASAGMTFFLGGVAGETLAAIGFLRITEHPVLQLSFGEFDFPAVASDPLPQFLPMPPTTLGPRADVEPEFWARSWKAVGPGGKRVSVEITGRPNGRLSVRVDEQVLPNGFQEIFDDIAPELGFNSDYAGDVWSAVRHRDGEQAAVPQSQRADQAIMLHRDATEEQAAPARQALRLGRQVQVQGAGAVMQMRPVQRLVLPGHGFLEAYSVFNGGAPVERRARYVRYGAIFRPVCDVMCSSTPMIK